MLQSYESTLAKNGFTPETYYFEDTVIGWDYDVFNALHSHNSVFVEEQIQNFRQPDNLDVLLLSRLTLKPDISLDSGIEYLLSVWKSELRYANATCEHFNVITQNGETEVHFLIISEHNAMTVKFVISLNKDVL